MTIEGNTTQTDQSSRLRKSSKALPVPTGNDHTAQACAVIEVIVKQLELFGFNRFGYLTKGDVKHWAEIIAASGHWVKAAKYKIAAFYQVHQLQFLQDKTLPAKPFPETIGDNPRRLLGGRAGRFIGKMIERTSGIERESFLSSMLQIKRAMPAPDEGFLLEAKRKTVKCLTATKARVESFNLENDASLHNTLTFANITEEVIRTTKEIFKNRKFCTGDLLSNPHMPSFSANHVTSRKKLGTFGFMRDLGLFDEDVDSDSDSEETTELNASVIADRGSETYGLLFHANHDEESIRNVVNNPPVFKLNGLNAMRDSFTSTYFRTLKIAQTEEPIAQAVALAEALKARVITKGPPATQYSLKPMQRFMWGQLAAHPVFELVGKPANSQIVQDRLRDLLPGEFWLSGDYSDATNQLDPILSNSVWATVCDVCCVPTIIRELGFRALTGHMILDDETGLLLPQQWGQLMGSIISFPVLCIINAAICRMTMEHSRNRVLSLRSLQLLVNGDDCVFPVNMHGYRFWQQVGAMSGLSPSVGKVYLSSSFLNINSTTFVYTPRTNEVLSDEMAVWSSFYEVPLVRLGLILGVKRSVVSGAVPLPENSFGAAEIVGMDYSSIGSRHHTLMKESPVECLQAVQKMFLRQNKELLAWCTKMNLPWYVPKCYGGVGLCPMPHLGWGPTRLDRQIVTAMVLLNLRNRNGDRMQCIQPKPLAMTRIQKVATLFLESALSTTGITPDEVWVFPDDPRTDGFDCPELAMWVTQLHPELVEETDKELASSAARRNSAVWSWYVRNLSTFAGKVAPFEDLKERKRIHLMQIISETGKAFVGSVYLEPIDQAFWGDYQEVDLWA